MPSPYVLLASVCAVLIAIGGAFGYGVHVGKDSEIAAQARAADAETRAMNAAAVAIANGIADIQVKQVTIRQEVEHDVRTNTIYRECHHSVDGLRDLNAALTNTVPAGGGGVPTPDAAH